MGANFERELRQKTHAASLFLPVSTLNLGTFWDYVQQQKRFWWWLFPPPSDATYPSHLLFISKLVPIPYDSALAPAFAWSACRALIFTKVRRYSVPSRTFVHSLFSMIGFERIFKLQYHKLSSPGDTLLPFVEKKGKHACIGTKQLGCMFASRVELTTFRIISGVIHNRSSTINRWISRCLLGWITAYIYSGRVRILVGEPGGANEMFLWLTPGWLPFF